MKISSNKIVHIVSLADNAYAKYLGVTFLSILTNLRHASPLSVHFSTLDCGLTEKSKFCIESLLQQKATQIENLTLEWIVPEKSYLASRFGTLPKQLNTLATYIRMDVCNLLKKDDGKIIFLDSDTLVLGNLLELWEIPMGNNHTLATRDLGFPKFKYRQWPTHKFPSEFKEYDPETSYFNAGLMVIDVAKWKQLSIAERALLKASKAVSEDPESLECFDQDPLNLVWGGNVGELALEWNAQSSVFMPNSRMKAEDIDTSVASSKPKILHYTMANCKPWKADCLHPVVEPYNFFLKSVEKHFDKYRDTSIF